MNIKCYPLLCLVFGLLGTSLSHSSAADSALNYYFEDNNDPSVPTNSGNAPFALHYLGDTQQTTTQAKFGKGSMLIGEKKGDVIFINHGSGFASQPSEFNDAIEKMTITAWVRPVNPSDGGQNSFYPGFLILARSGGENAWGVGHFMFGFAYNKLELRYYSDGGLKQVFQSPLIKRRFESEEWTHLAVTFDQGKMVFYVNGLPIGDADGAPMKATNISEMPGKSVLVGFTASHAGDCIDDFGFLVGRALSESDIEKVYDKGLQEFVKSSPSK
ncbi:MAG: LamG domain-containing protein [Chthoniobacterales bacterium]